MFYSQIQPFRLVSPLFSSSSVAQYHALLLSSSVTNSHLLHIILFLSIISPNRG
ncbi:hypothetical protein C5167_009703 [Papaver somniferum]|uniref:Uncharacterized protein n=1 Tax=Papaver somniferum TaxID=3469 RepID=A0A4Y7JZB7_PAPSO|nr:hypothetical protein C5167_009703 [Papaver somniferum]